MSSNLGTPELKPKTRGPENLHAPCCLPPRSGARYHGKRMKSGIAKLRFRRMEAGAAADGVGAGMPGGRADTELILNKAVIWR